MECPFCAEKVKDEVLVCKHCSRDLRVVRPVLIEIEDIVSEIEKLRHEFDYVSTRLYRRQHPVRYFAIHSIAYVLIPTVLLVAAHIIITIVLNVSPLYLRIASVLIPLPFGLAIHVIQKVGIRGAAIVGVDDHFCAAIADRIEQAGRAVTRVSVKRPVADGICLEGETIVRVDGGARSRIASIAEIGSLRGLHNAQNAACASAAILALGVSTEVLQQGLRSFPGLAHRMEQIGRNGRVLLINDSKGTNADAAARALSSFKDIFWIAGGKPKTGGIESLREFFPRIRKAYLIGEAAEEFAATLGDVPHEISKTLEEAVPHATRDAEASDVTEPVVLLSPACASFDQFPNFEKRGERFREIAKALPGGLTAV